MFEIFKRVFNEYNLPEPLLRFDDNNVPEFYNTCIYESNNRIFLQSVPMYVYLNTGKPNFSEYERVLRFSFTPHFLYLFEWSGNTHDFRNIIIQSKNDVTDYVILGDLCYFIEKMSKTVNVICQKYNLK